MNSFKLSGIAIAAGGVSLIIVNAVFTPMLDFDVPFPEMMASKAYLWRLSLAPPVFTLTKPAALDYLAKSLLA